LYVVGFSEIVVVEACQRSHVQSAREMAIAL
jgi:hypothetical protein